MSVTPTDPPDLKRQFPHVDGIADWRAQQSIRLLWDRCFDLEARLQAAEATVGDLADASNLTETQLTRVDRKADEALAIAQGTRAEVAAAAAGDYPLPAGGDGGQGAAGCGAAGSDGHPAVTGQTAYNAGLIVCGTAAEFPALTAAVATEAIRLANAEELVKRMIWHLQQKGFVAGRQQNPSGAISKDKLAVITDGITRAYDVFSDVENFAVALSTHMAEVAPPHLVPDAGTAD